MLRDPLQQVENTAVKIEARVKPVFAFVVGLKALDLTFAFWRPDVDDAETPYFERIRIDFRIAHERDA